MIRALSPRSRIPALLATLALLAAGGCTRDQPEPVPTPEPAPRYLPVPRDLCIRISVEEIAERFDLAVPPWYEPSGDYRDFSTLSGMGCVIGFLDESERFTPVRGHGEFKPGGVVSVTVYRDPQKSHAADNYEPEVRAFRRQWPDSPLAAIEGWWDEGTSVETVDPIPQGSLRRDPHASVSRVDYFLYHENLYLHAFVDGTSVNGEVGDAFPILYGIMDALIEQTKTQLTLVETS